MDVQPFKVEVADVALDDLRARLERTRWPDELERAGWDYGTNLSYLKELVHYWRSVFDWRAQERAINRLAHFRVSLDGLGLHFVYECGRGQDPLPLLITHGWPS